MKALKTLGIILLGLPLLVLGSWRLFDPISFFAFNGLQLAADPGLLSEARATGGVVVGFALVIVSGAFLEHRRSTSLLVATVLFFSFAVGRLIGLGADGSPGDQVMQGLISELIFGSVALAALIRTRSARALSTTARQAQIDGSQGARAAA